MKTLTNDIFASVYFLVNELNKIDKYNNLISHNPYRQFIQTIIDDKHLLSEDKILKENVNTSFPLIRETSAKLSPYDDDNQIPNYSIYFISGVYFDKNSQKTISLLKNCNRTLNISINLFDYFPTTKSQNGGLIFFEDTITMNFNDVHTIVDDNYDLVKEPSSKELRLIYLQNNIIFKFSNFLSTIFDDMLIYNQKIDKMNSLYDISNSLLFTYPAIIRKNNTYKIPKILEMMDEQITIGLYELLTFANLRLYFIFKFNLNMNDEKDKNLLDKVMKQTILSCFLHPYVTDLYFNQNNEYKKQYENDKQYCIQLISCINDIIELWTSNNFQQALFEYKYYCAFRPYDVISE